MLAQRSMQQAMRRLATRPAMASQMTFAKAAAPMAMRSNIQSRPVATQSIPVSESTAILAKQRLNRPTAPHLAIYKIQMSMFCSAMNRVTGLTVAVPFYLFGLTYLASPLLSLPMDSASMAAAFGGLGWVLKGGLKFAVALPFTFHSFNGIRHLVWDSGRGFKNQNVIRSGWVAIGASVVSAAYLAIFV